MSALSKKKLALPREKRLVEASSWQLLSPNERGCRVTSHTERLTKTFRHPVNINRTRKGQEAAKSDEIGELAMHGVVGSVLLAYPQNK